jgi:Bacterial SH3 domain
MRRNMLLMAALVLALLVGAGCAGSTPETVSVPPTKTPKPTFTATAEPPTVVFATATPAIPPTPEATATPAPTEVPPSATPEPAPSFTAGQNVNIRSGPGTNYPRLGTLVAGQSFEILGKNAAGSWLQFVYDGDAAWVSADMVAVSGDLGAVEVAQNVPAPPVVAAPRPQPTSPPAPAQPTSPPATPKPQYPFQLSSTGQCLPNEGYTYFDGFVRYRSNAPRNGVCVHVAYYGPRSTKCSGCDGQGDGVWGFSPFGGPAPAGTQVEIYVVPCPPASEMPKGGQSDQTGFGDLTPQSEKWRHTFSQSEECHGITFVGD